MNPKERLHAVFTDTPPDRVPFAPIIQEHAARLIGKTPSQMAKDASLMVEAQLAAFELYQHDLVAVGVDNYNLECEALGGRILFFDGVEMPALAGPLLEDKADLEGLRILDPERHGRMPLVLEAGARLQERLGDQVVVTSTIEGPFTLASNLRGFEQLVMDVYEDPDFAHRLLDFTTRVGQRYADGLIARGLTVTVAESCAAPPLTSPRLFNNLVVDYERKLVSHIVEAGQRHVPLITSGDSTPLLNGLVATGAALLFIDHRADLAQFKERIPASGPSLWGNVDPDLVESGPVDGILEAGRRLLDAGKAGGRFALGAGPLPYATPSEHILALRQLAESHGAYR